MLGDYSKVVLTSPRLILRLMTEGDAEHVVRWRNDPEVTKWLFSSEPITVESHLSWFRSRKGDRIDFMVLLRESGTPIGTAAFTNIDWEERTGYSGFVLGDRNQWGNGYATEGWRVWLRFAFTTLGFSTVYGMRWADNERVMKLGDRMGMEFVELRPKHIRRGDQLLDVMVVKMTRERAMKLGILEECSST